MSVPSEGVFSSTIRKLFFVKETNQLSTRSIEFYQLFLREKKISGLEVVGH